MCPSSIAAVLISSFTRSQILFRKLVKFAGSDCVVRLSVGCWCKSPTRSTLSLILNWRNDTPGAPINRGCRKRIWRDQSSRAVGCTKTRYRSANWTDWVSAIDTVFGVQSVEAEASLARKTLSGYALTSAAIWTTILADIKRVSVLTNLANLWTSCSVGSCRVSTSKVGCEYKRTGARWTLSSQRGALGTIFCN